MSLTIYLKAKAQMFTSPKKENWQYYAALVLGIFAYAFVHVNYNIYYVDDAWVMSNVWNIARLGVAEDLVFIEPDENGYVQYFGITYAYIMGHLLNLIGWTKSNVFLVNSAMIWGTAFVWYHILKSLPFSKKIANLSLVFLPIFPPFFFAAHCGRPEAFILFIISIQILLFIRKRYFWAAFLTGFAFEAHIMGGVGMFYLMAYVIYQKKTFLENKEETYNLVSQFFLGGVSALAYYFMIHGSHFSWAELSSLIERKKDMGSPLNNYILNYFMNYDWYSRVWEFALFLGGVTLYFKNGLFKKNRFLTILLFALLISTLITRRENKNYFVYIFPAFMLLYFYTFEQLKQLKKFSTVLLVSMSLYYGLHFYFNSSYDFEKITQQVNEELKDKESAVVGVPDFWFANMESDFVPIHHRKSKTLHSLDRFYFIQSDYLEWRCKIYDETLQYYKDNFNAVLVKEVPVYNGEKILIWECQRIDASSNQWLAKKERSKYFKKINQTW